MTKNNTTDGREAKLFEDMMLNSEAMVKTEKTVGIGFEPQIVDRSNILMTLYQELCDSKNKNSFIHKVTKKAIKKGKRCVASEIMDSEYADARELTDELYNQYEMQLDSLKAKNEKIGTS